MNFINLIYNLCAKCWLSLRWSGILRSVKSQINADLVLAEMEAWNHVKYGYLMLNQAACIEATVCYSVNAEGGRCATNNSIYCRWIFKSSWLLRPVDW